jgi:hypothetical protein
MALGRREIVAPLPRRAFRYGGLQRAVSLSARLNLPLVAIVAAAFAFTAYYTLKVSEWSVMTDELLYVRLALSIGDSLSPLPRVHGEDFAVFSQLYPLLTAPFFHFLDMPAAFRAVHFMNAGIMASAAVPAYLLAREIVAYRPAAYLAAALTVAVPWMTMSTMVLTEVAAYPAFLWAVLAMQRAIAVPSISRDLLALAGIALAFLGRTQFIVLGLILPVAIVVHELAFGALRSPRPPLREAARAGLVRSLTEHRLLAAAGALALVVTIPAALAGSLSDALGNYHVTAERGLLPEGIWKSVVVHLDFVVVAVGILPFVLALGWAASTILRPVEKQGHAYAVLMTLVVVALAFQVSSFDLNFGGGIRDRYLFYVAPLLAVGMVTCLVAPRRPWAAVLVAGLGFAWMAGAADYAASGGPYFDSPASAFHVVLDGKSYELGQRLSINDLSPATTLTIGSVLLAVISAAAARYAPRQTVFWAVGLSVLGFCVAETRYVFGRMVLGAGGGRSISGTSVEDRDWIDRAVPDEASVALVPAPVILLPRDSGADAPFLVSGFENMWWAAEFWNKQVDRAYSYSGSPTYTPFPYGDLSLDYKSGRLIATEQSRYLVITRSDPRFRPVGRVVKDGGLQILRAHLPYRAEWASRRVEADGWTKGGGSSTVRVYGEPHTPTGRRVRVMLSSGRDVRGPRRYGIRVGNLFKTSTLRPRATRTETLTVCVPQDGFSDVSINVPRQTRLPDGRLVGLRVVQVQTEPAPAGCAAR